MSGEHALKAARLASLVAKLPMPPGSAPWLLGSEGSSWDPHSKLRSGCRAQHNPDARLWGHCSVSLHGDFIALAIATEAVLGHYSHTPVLLS